MSKGMWTTNAPGDSKEVKEVEDIQEKVDANSEMFNLGYSTAEKSRAKQTLELQEKMYKTNLENANRHKHQIDIANIISGISAGILMLIAYVLMFK